MNKYKRYGWMLAVLVGCLIIGIQANQPVSAQQATPTATIAPGQPIPLYGLFEATLPVNSADVKNVYDPSEINVTVRFTSPSNRAIQVAAFWMQPYQQTCKQACEEEQLSATGTPGWRVRFTTDEAGNWSYIAQQSNAGGPSQPLAQGQFTVVPSKAAGFIRIGKNRRYFGYDNGTPYFPVGPNLGWSWSGAQGTLGYQAWLKKLHDVGANFGRLFIDVPWFIALDWDGPVGDYTAAQQDGWKLDTILQTAEEQGIALQIVLVWNQGFTSYAGLPVNPPDTPQRPDTKADWSTNPYNFMRGGPFNTPVLFFSSPQGMELLQRRLRYVVARWGYSTSVFAWEMIDSLDRVVAITPDIAGDWLKTSVSYLRQIDPYKHLISAGVRDSTKADLLSKAVLDFNQVRFYQRRPIEAGIDQVAGTLNLLSSSLDGTDRPILMSEFSLNPWFEPTADDPTGVHVRETMWAAALSGSAGSASSWWWDTYIFPQDMTSIFAPLAAFTQGIPWNTGNLQPVDVSIVGDDTIAFQPLKVSGYGGTYGGPKAPDITYRLTPDGVLPPINKASGFLYGVTYNTQLSQPQKYIITPPTDTSLTVSVRKVSEKAPAKLVILIDGKTAGMMTLSARSEPASLTIPISAGEHTVVLDNLGDDYLVIDSLEVASYVAPLRTVALADRTAGIFLAWLQNRDYTWQNAAKNVEAKPATVSLKVNGMPPGLYRLELWDPFTGNVVGQENVTIPGQKDGILTVDLLPISKMLAVRAMRVAEPGNAPSPTTTLTPTPKILSTPVPSATP